MLGSNQRPPPCRGGALPAELIARGTASVAVAVRSGAGTSGRYARRGRATWRSGYAAACKAVYTGSIPVVASLRIQRSSRDNNPQPEPPHDRDQGTRLSCFAGRRFLEASEFAPPLSRPRT